MAAGVSFLNTIKPPRPLRIFYLQMEIGYPYLQERIQSLALEPKVLELAGGNVFVTPQVIMSLNEEGIEILTTSIKKCFPKDPVDIIAIDPLRSVFDGGAKDSSENDNSAMMFFLQKRLGDLRNAVNPKAGIIITHHTRKMVKKQFEEDPFQAFSGASSLRAFYTSGMILFRGDEEKTESTLSFELRNGTALPPKKVDKIKGKWVEIDKRGEPKIGKVQMKKNNEERERKHDVILQILHDEARKGKLYTTNQFSKVFEDKGGLGSGVTINDRLDLLTTRGNIKYIQNASLFGYEEIRGKSGYLCVEKMMFRDKDTKALRLLLPSHYKRHEDGVILPVENEYIWVMPEIKKA